jgi:hypothetical protein
MSHLDSPASSALVASLREARNDAAVEGELKQRVQSRLSVTLLGLAPTLSAVLPATHAPAGAVSRAWLAAKGAVATKGSVLAWLAPVVAAGVITGVAVDRVHVRSVAPHTSATASNNAYPSASVNPQPEPVRLPVIAPESLEDISEKHPAASVSGVTMDSTSSLAAERRLLDEARQALARGEPQAGLRPLNRHAQRFPNGVLTEEREALAVRLLAALGNQSAAVARAKSFHRRFPDSLFAAAVDSAIVRFSRRNTQSESNL